MPEGTTAYTGPDGVRHETTFQYDYAPPPQPPQELDPAAVAEGLKSGKIDESLKQIHAAQYFLGSRLLKQAQEKGDTNGIMRATMMMFPQHPQVGVNLYKSLVPPVARPVNALEQARIDEIKRRATTPNPKDVLAREKFEWMKAHPKANPEDYETIHFPGTKPIEGLPAVPGEVKSFLGIDALAKDKPAQPAIPGVPGTPSTTRKVLIAKPSTSTSPGKPPTPEKIRVISPDGKKGFIPASQKDSALEQGYKLVP